MLLGSRWFSRYVAADRWFLHRHVPALVGMEKDGQSIRHSVEASTF